MYNFCPIGAIVCIECKYPVCSRDDVDFIKGIWHHENKNKNHPEQQQLKLDSKKDLVKRFKEFIDKMASDITTYYNVGDHVKAREVLLKHIATAETFVYCDKPECQRLVVSAKKHYGKRHVTACKQKRMGHISLIWKEKEPIIIDGNFQLYDDNGELCKGLCRSLRDAIQHKVTVQPLPATHDKVVALTRLLAEGEHDIVDARNDVPIQAVEIHQNPDLWLKRSGWHAYLDGFGAHDIHKTMLPFDEVKDVQLLQLETNFEEELKNKVQFVRNISPLHQLFFEVERRPHKPYPRKPFTLPSGKTCERYILIMRTLFRIMIRVYDHQENVNVDGDTGSKFPTISFMENQKRIIALIHRYPNIRCNYIDLLLALAEQTYTDHPYECALICMLAYSSLNYDATFKPPKYFTHTYAAILGIYKVLVIHYCMSQSTEQTTTMDLAMVAVPKYLSHPEDTSHRPNVMSYVINVFSYAFAITRNTPASGFIGWKGQEVRYQLIHLTMTNFRHVVLETCSDAEKLLLWLCEVSTMNQLPIIPWDNIYDNIDNYNSGYSFITEAKNSFITSSTSFDRRRNAQLWIDNEGGYHTGHVKRFKEKVTEFLELLLTLVHITGGQPARGTEIIILQHTNSSSSSRGSRNIYIDRGLVCIFSQYHKNIVKSNKTKDIFRFLPRRVGSLVVYYLWLVVPYYQKVVSKCEGKKCMSTYLWTDHIVDTVTSESEKSWPSSKLSALLQKVFSSKIGTDMNTSSYRHIAIAIVRQYLSRDINIRATLPDADDNDEEEVVDNIWDLQASHSTPTALNTYGRTIFENSISSQTIVDKYRYISLMWHDFLFPVIRNDGVTTDKLLETLSEQRLQRFHRLRTADPKAMLRSFLGDEAEFRGNQERVIKAIAKGRPYILQVAATGVGKSLSFMLPAYTTINGTSVVVVPLIALQHDLESRCTRQGLHAKIWKADETFNEVNIVFVTPESASNPKFLDFVQSLKIRSQLDRIYIDECHLLLANSNSFRKKMDDLNKALKVANVQMVMMTATLPKSDEFHLFQRLDILETVEIERDRTIRTNIKYEIVTTDGTAYIDIIKTRIADMRDGRCIIYVRTIKLGKALAEILHVNHYHSKAEHKQEIYSQWASSLDTPVVIATSALGCGVDIPDVRIVIHVGCPGSITDFAQESGRAGRDGRQSYSLLIHIPAMKFNGDANIIEYIETENCRRSILDRILDDDLLRKECGPDEECCDNCTYQRQKAMAESITDGLTLENLEYHDTESIEFVDSTMENEVESVLVEEEHRDKRFRYRQAEGTVTKDVIKSKMKQFSAAQCLTCCLTNQGDSVCVNVHHKMNIRQAHNQTLNFLGVYRSQKKKIVEYCVCYSCLCPQDICEKRTFAERCNLRYRDVMLDVIHLACIIDVSRNKEEFADIDYMISPVYKWGGYTKTIQLVKVFYEVSRACVTKK